MKNYVVSIILFFSAVGILSGQKTICGQVTSNRGDALVGVGVSIKGTTTGTITDIDGKYQLTIPSNASTLIFSFSGFNTEEIELDSSFTFDTQMIERILQDVVIACPGHRRYTWREGHIEAHLLENGLTQLLYQVTDTLQVACCERYEEHINYYKDIKIKYLVSKSTDNIHYHRIGTSYSDSTAYGNNTHTRFSWGMSQFLDKERNKIDSTFYLVEGVDDDNTDISIFREKISVPPADCLKINSVFPVPQSNQLNVHVSSPLSGKAIFAVMDMVGHQLLMQQSNLSEKQNKITITTPNLPSGIYYLYVEQDHSYDNYKFTITK